MKENNNNRLFLVLSVIISLFFVTTCSQEQGKIETEKFVQNDSTIKQEVKYTLKKNILDTWFPRIIDEENGGFYTQFNYKWELDSAYPKMIVSQARDLWVASLAAQKYPDRSKFSEAAHHGFKFLKNRMWDEKYGGFYFILPTSEEKKESVIKRAYGNAFAILGLSGYYSLTKNEEAKDLAIKAFRWMEENLYDSTYGGYYDKATRKGISYANKRSDGSVGLLEDIGTAKYKDFNSTINILTAFPYLYRIWKDKTLEKRLTELFHIVRDTMTNDKGYLNTYFEKDWELISLKDSSDQYIKNNYSMDNISFGSNIETAFILLEAGDVLGLNNKETHKTAKSLVDHTLQYGFDDNYAGIYYTGYHFKGDPKPTVLEDRKSWWCQAEGLRSLLLHSYLYSNNDEYKTAFYRLWDYTKNYIIDQKYGGWYHNGIDVEGYDKKQQKASKWKSCFHTFRTLEYMLRMLDSGEPVIGLTY